MQTCFIKISEVVQMIVRIRVCVQLMSCRCSEENGEGGAEVAHGVAGRRWVVEVEVQWR